MYVKYLLLVSGDLKIRVYSSILISTNGLEFNMQLTEAPSIYCLSLKQVVLMITKIRLMVLNGMLTQSDCYWESSITSNVLCGYYYNCFKRSKFYLLWIRRLVYTCLLQIQMSTFLRQIIFIVVTLVKPTTRRFSNLESHQLSRYII